MGRMPQLPGTDLTVSDLCLGGNVFGWTADEPTSHAVLDRFVDAVPSTQRPFVDTAEMYGEGRSEQILGGWMAERGLRDRMVVAAQPADRPHRPQPRPLTAFDELVREGKVLHVAASNYSPQRLTEAPETSERLGLTRYVALQPHYDLVERPVHEDGLRDVVAEHGLGCMPCFALAGGFLTGKYRAGQRVDSPRAEKASAYVGKRGDRVLSALREVAGAHGVGQAAVALRWLADRPTVTAPIASARDVDQLAGLLPVLDLVLTDDERAALDRASE